jgi:tetratricopeptide (TPR) repeat protein
LLTHFGDNYYQLDSIELALKYYHKVFDRNPADQSTAKKLASLYLKNKDFKKSIAICDTVLKSDSTNIIFLKIKGMASFNKNDFKTAEACFDYLYRKGDSSKFIVKHLGICEFNNSKFSTSRGHLIKAFEMDSNDYETCFYLGKGFLNSTTPEKGLYFLNRIDSLLQPNPLILSALYDEKQSIYSTVNNYNEALNCYKIAYRYNPKPEYLFFIASMYQNKLNDSQKALEYYSRFLESLPPKPDSEHKFEENQIIISLRKIAEDNIVKLKEELFFNGKLSD